MSLFQFRCGAAWSNSKEAVIQPICNLVAASNNALTTVRLGGNGKWREGDGAALVAATKSASCVIEELDVSGSGLSVSEALDLVKTCRTLKALTLEKWTIPIDSLRSGASVELSGQSVSNTEGVVLGELLKQNGSLTRLDLSGAHCSDEAVVALGDALRTSKAPLAELLLHGMRHRAKGSSGGHTQITLAQQSENWASAVIDGMIEDNYEVFLRGLDDSGGMAEFALLYDSSRPANLQDDGGFFRLEGTGSGSVLKRAGLRAGANALDVAIALKRARYADRLCGKYPDMRPTAPEHDKHTGGDKPSVGSRLATLVSGARRPSLRVVDCSGQRDVLKGESALAAEEGGSGVIAELCALISTPKNRLATLRLGGNGAWSAEPLSRALASASCVVEELDIASCTDSHSVIAAAQDTLRTLDLSGCQGIDFKLLVARPFFQKLQVLRLDSTYPGASLSYLASGLAASKAMQTLSLQMNGLTDNNAKQLADACDPHTYLLLNYNALSPSCRKILPEHIEFMATITWSPTDRHEWVKLSDDWLEASYIGPGNQSHKNGLVRATTGFASGKHYWPFTFPNTSASGSGYPSIGVVTQECPLGGEDELVIGGSHGHGWGFHLDSFLKVHGGDKLGSSSGSPSKDKTYGLLLDMDAGELSLFINGQSQGVAFTGLEGKGPLFPAVEAGTLESMRIRADFSVVPPEGGDIPKPVDGSPPDSDYDSDSEEESEGSELSDDDDDEL